MECPVCFGRGSYDRYWRLDKRCKRCKGRGYVGTKKRGRKRTLRGKARRRPLSVVKRKRRRAL